MRLTDEPGRPLRSVLVANRGEIAVRILRAAADAGMRGVAIHTPPDAGALHVRRAVESVAIEDYLDIDAVVDSALRAGVEAVHPGYGFLAENAEAAAAVTAAGLVWIGPPAPVIAALGDKLTARRIARSVGAPLTAGTDAIDDIAAVENFVAEHGLPVLLKAAFGGGGRGMRVVREAAAISEAFAAASREAAAAFGRGTVYVERLLEGARHVEVQVLADDHGTVLVIGLRDCSVQRRNQKLVEEAPAPSLPDGVRDRLVSSARAICVAAGYRGAGTVEYLVGPHGEVSFLEVNTRLQVEHPVTEETTGVDLVAEQFRIAAGARLVSAQDPVSHGHAIEFRLVAEDPHAGFVPAPGTVTALRLPSGPGVRWDGGVEAGDTVEGRYDSMFGKLIVSGPDRPSALRRARRALAEFEVAGVPTPIAFYRWLLDHPGFAGPDFAVHNRWVEAVIADLPKPEVPLDRIVVRVGRRSMPVDLPGLATLGERAAEVAATLRGAGDAGPADSLVLAPMQGTIVSVAVKEGDVVAPGDLIAVLEAMKMQNPVTAAVAGTITDLRVSVGDTVTHRQHLCEVLEQV
ncbi:MAG TPA: biotin carboxylase N-terminal domain-containing protein [Sporichthyaceae bacterium]